MSFYLAVGCLNGLVVDRCCRGVMQCLLTCVLKLPIVPLYRLTVKVRNTEAASPGQIVWVVMTYKPPAQVVTDFFDAKLNATGDWSVYNRIVSRHRSKL